jgi:phage terminase large subunit-like protein
MEGREARGLWMPGSLNELETLILERRIEIRSNRATISAIMSAAIERDPFDNRWFSKRKAVNRIDALVALATAIGAMTAQTEPVFDVRAMVA